MWSLVTYAAAVVSFAQAPEAEPIDPVSQGESLRHLCMSDAGVAYVVKAISEQREVQRAQQKKLNTLNAELGAAVDARPIDLERLRRAVEARDLFRYEMDRVTSAQTMAMLRKLSPADQEIFAGQLDLNFPRRRYPTLGCK